MTECQHALMALRDIAELKTVTVSPPDYQELLKLELVAASNGHREAADSSTKIQELRTKISALSAEKETLYSDLGSIELMNTYRFPAQLYKKDKDYRAKKDQLSSLEKREKALRTELIDLIQTSAETGSYATLNGRRVNITYRGRELLGEMDQRIERVETMDVRRFIDQMASVKSHFHTRAAKARAILKKISPVFPRVDEIHLRSAAVGLSGRPGNHDEAEALFERAYRKISGFLGWNGPVSITLAEALALSARDKSELDGLLERARELNRQPWERYQDRRDQVRAVAIILSSGGDAGKLVSETRKISRQYCPASPSAAAYLASQQRTWHGGGLLDRFAFIRDTISPEGEGGPDYHIAAALMAATDFPQDVVIKRFATARSALGRFNISAVHVPSAMIAILPVSTDESMDNLRLASAAISANRLSLGGMENMSLGMKLLLHSSSLSGGPEESPGDISPVSTTGMAMPSVMAITGVSVAAGLTLAAGLLAFHEFALHKTAVRDYAFHPVHMHYVYG